MRAIKHYGDITKLNGHELPVVDVITGGSPCQDLSVAGKRAGLDGERSGLFMEQIRIVKEMREHDRTTGRTTEFIRPRYMVWENVPGALSSNGGKDFQAVLTETIRIAKADAPEVPLFGNGEGGRWQKAGCFMGIGDNGVPFSIAWRVHDTQFWGTTQYIDGRMFFPGTAQRRKRIALVADFNGLTAPEILFERKSLRGDPAQKRREEQAFTSSPGESPEIPDSTLSGDSGGNGEAISYQERCGKPGGGKGILVQRDHVGALSTLNNQMVVAGDVYESHSQDSRYNPMGAVSETVSAKYGTGGNNTPLVLESHRGKDELRNAEDRGVQTERTGQQLEGARLEGCDRFGSGGGYADECS